ncbi:hypothetical protein [Amycolatopsis sp. FDAARGOS 1241]|uniref:hypothetical protein n=1 Tax=Amycolatopsis sp. FDAARGOS 1241 TaxID=2778070 RepID=UPI00195230C8|nr:hypothetical protein [Amycolatopsis sp. FDAARGOS 1241]QRP46875.1 hypothetical protein I6J71_02125 [Amycolatopsis sp. FDAARGOS 1241]
MTLLVVLVGAVLVVLGLAAVLDFRARRRSRRAAAADGWETLQESRRDFHAAGLARYQSNDLSWLDRRRRYRK